MALIQCSECSREISDQAAACPQCGAPVLTAVAAPVQTQQFPPTPRTSGCRIVVGVAVGFLLLLLFAKACTHSNADGEVVPDTTVGTAAPEGPPAAVGSLHVIANTCEKSRFGYTQITVTVQNNGTTDIPFAKMFVEFPTASGAVIAKDSYFSPVTIPPGARASADAMTDQAVTGCTLRSFQARDGEPVLMQ